MYYKIKFCLLIISAFLVGCSSIRKSSIDKYNSYDYKPGHPEVRFSINHSVDDTQNYLNINMELVENSLIFKREGEDYESEFTFEINITNLESQKNKLITDEKTFTSSSGTFSNETTFKVQKTVPVNSGDYKVDIWVKDLKSDKTSSYSEEIIVPKLNSSNLILTDFKVSRFNPAEKKYFPVTTYAIKQSDSIRVDFQIVNPDKKKLSVNSKLLKFKSDTSYPRSMTSVGFSSSDIEYKGIDYSSEEVVYNNTRTLSKTDRIRIEYNFTDLEKGNYRFSVQVESNGNQIEEEGLDFGIRDESYPSLTDAEDLLEPLILLMNEKRYSELQKIESQSEIKEKIDRFWIRNVQNKSKAKQVVSLFYERVEEANKLFSTFKEGWKTDRGMIYILFGPPYIVEKTATKISWSYSTNRYDFRTNFIFQEPQTEILYYGFDHYLLDRSQAYHSVYYNQIQRWKKGLILSGNNF
jgi:GWxTD domain-containing protein